MRVIYRKSADARTGVVNFCSWDRLRPFLHEAAGIRHDEQVEAVSVTDRGVEIFLGQKSADDTWCRAKVIP